MTDNEDTLVMRRPKRSTAGNRMEAALAEFKAEDVGVDVEEDVDFVMGKDEEDAFESDFESTDEEAAQEDVDTYAEKTARDDERRSRKTGGKTQLERITAAAHIRHQATFDPELYEVEAQRKKATAAFKLKRKVSLGVVVDAETGEVMTVENGETAEGEAGETGEDASRRRSKRRFTVESRTAHIKRLQKEEIEKKTATPKKVKSKGPPPTQEELLRRALEMEEGNIDEHKNYLATEEEKRKRARLIRTAVAGPLLRWISRKEEVKFVVELPAPAPPPTPAPTPVRPASASGPPSTMTYQYGYAYPNMPGTASTSQETNAYPNAPSPYYPYALIHPPHGHPHHSSPSSTPVMPPSSSHPTFIYHTYPAQPSASPQPVPPPPPPPPQRIERIETVAKCYVVHELDQDEDVSKPLWYETMGAMFGEHVDWEELKVYMGKGRPLSRPVHTCAITGQPARYMDPRTGVPFASVDAFKTLTQILEHKFVWDETLGCYTGEAEELEEAVGTPVQEEEAAPVITQTNISRKRATRQSTA